MFTTSRTFTLLENGFKPIFSKKTLSNSIPQWFLAVETAIIQIYSTAYYYNLKKLNSYAYITKTYHEGKPQPFGTFVLKRHSAHVHFSDKLKPLRISPYKILDRLSDVTYELLLLDGSTLHVQRNHLIPYYPKEPLLYPHLRHFLRFSVLAPVITRQRKSIWNMLVEKQRLKLLKT